MSVKQDVQKIVQDLQNSINETFSKSKMRDIGREAIDYIRIRTRLGYGVRQQGQPKFKFKKLSPLYIALRRAVSKGNTKKIKQAYGELGIKNPSALPTLSDETAPNKSNLTFSGQLLDSLKLTRLDNRRVTIAPDGMRKEINKSNLSVAQEVSDNGRPFNNLSDLEIKKLNRFVSNQFASVMKKRFLFKNY